MSLKDSIFLGLCAMLIVLGRAVLRLHLHLPGHALVVMTAGLLLARGAVSHPFAGTVAATLAGLLSLVLGMVKVTPFWFLLFMVPGLMVDICARLMPRLFSSYLLCAVTGVLVGTTKFFDTFLHDVLADMAPELAVQHALLSMAPAVAFAVLGSLAVPPLIGRLRARGAIT